MNTVISDESIVNDTRRVAYHSNRNVRLSNPLGELLVDYFSSAFELNTGHNGIHAKSLGDNESPLVFN